MANKTSSGKLGLVACISMLAGGCIGSSIFSLSGMTMYYAGPAAILSWLVAAILLGSYGLQAAELSLRYPKSGGVYTFPARAISPKLGFVTAWGYLVSNVIAVAFAAIYVGTYLGVAWPIFNGVGMQIALAVAAVILCLILCWNKISAAGKINNILVTALIVCMAIYIIAAFTHPNFNWGNFSNFFGQGVKGSLGWVEAIPNAMTGFGSIVAVAFLVGQVENPKKTVPLATIVALLLVVCLYMLMIVATLGHITAAQLDEQAFLRFIPMFGAAMLSMNDLPWLPGVISIAAVLALLTTMLVVLNLTANALKAMADDGSMPKFLTKETKGGSPAACLLVIAGLAAILSCFPGATETLVNLGSIFAAANISLVVLSAIFARKKTTLEPGTFTAPGGNVVSIITLVGLLATYVVKILSSWTQLGFTVLIYAVGIIFMVAYSKMSKKAA